jgi:hypothetical protein
MAHSPFGYSGASISLIPSNYLSSIYLGSPYFLIFGYSFPFLSFPPASSSSSSKSSGTSSSSFPGSELVSNLSSPDSSLGTKAANLSN